MHNDDNVLSLDAATEDAPAVRRLAWKLLSAAGAPYPEASAALLWPGPTERRRAEAPPAHATLFGDERQVWLDLSHWESTPVTAPLVRLTEVGRALQLLAVGSHGGTEGRNSALQFLRGVTRAPVWRSAYMREPTTLALAEAGGASAAEVQLGPGLIVIAGRSAAGKSTLLRLLSSEESVATIDWGEPVAAAAGSYTLVNLESRVAKALGEGYSVIVIDSFKNLLLAGENLGAGGLSQSFLKQLSTIAAGAAEAGLTVVGTMNLLSMSQQAIGSTLESLRGSVTSTLFLERQATGAPTVTATSRYIEGRQTRRSVGPALITVPVT